MDSRERQCLSYSNSRLELFNQDEIPVEMKDIRYLDRTPRSAPDSVQLEATCGEAVQ